MVLKNERIMGGGGTWTELLGKKCPPGRIWERQADEWSPLVVSQIWV
jgi:hypothetical protein